MSEAPVAEKKKPEVTQVLMKDGRTVNFVGKRKVNKETLIDDSKIVVDGGVVQIEQGAVSIRMDFRNGESRTMPLPLSLLAKFAGHGGEQKFGDELASPADKPMSEDDMVLAIDDLFAEISQGRWGRARGEGGGGVSGAHIVIKALAEVRGKTVEEVKQAIQARLGREPKISRKDLYDAFRKGDTPVAAVIARMESEEGKKAIKADAAAELEAI